MIKISKQKALFLHQLMAEETGGSAGVRDEGLLESALEGAFAGFGDVEFYTTLEEKGARLGYALISNHAFVDGNKRIGILVMLTFLEVNGMRVICSDGELIDIGLGVARQTLKFSTAALASWSTGAQLPGAPPRTGGAHPRRSCARRPPFARSFRCGFLQASPLSRSSFMRRPLLSDSLRPAYRPSSNVRRRDI